MSLQRRFIVILLIVTYIALGFFREYIFLNVNEQMRVVYYGSTDSHVSPLLSWLSNFSYAQLYYGKWPLTLFFTLLFALLAVFVVRMAFQTNIYTRSIVWAYASVFSLGLLFYFIGYLTNNTENVYPIARFLAGLVESPVLLLMICAGLLYARNKT